MIPRWWRIAVVLEREGAPWTWTFHVRAPTEKKARELVKSHLGEEPYAVFACHPSDPLHRAPRTPEIAAHYGPYRRSWADPLVAPLRVLLHEDEGAEG